jgi:pyruvate formate-lyase activating enzyme-like uncharacterized protein
LKVNREKLRQISKCIDEVRFHPNLFGNWTEEKKKIRFALEFYKKKMWG